MADWVHCNACFAQPLECQKVFHLTNCGHLFCANCIPQGGNKECKMCGQPCSTIVLSRNLKPDVEVFFTDPIEILRKSFKQAVQVNDFQNGHRQRLSKHKANKANHNQHPDQLLAYQREIQKLQEENEEMRRAITNKMNRTWSQSQIPRQQKNSTPGRQGTYNNNTQQQSQARNEGISMSMRSSPMNVDQERQQPRSAERTMQSQNRQAKTPVGPARLTIRTPPTNGMISTPSPRGRIVRLSGGSLTQTPRKGNTPGSIEATLPNQSPSRSRSSTPTGSLTQKTQLIRTKLTPTNMTNTQQRPTQTYSQQVNTQRGMHTDPIPQSQIQTPLHRRFDLANRTPAHYRHL